MSNFTAAQLAQAAAHRAANFISADTSIQGYTSATGKQSYAVATRFIDNVSYSIFSKDFTGEGHAQAAADSIWKFGTTPDAQFITAATK